MSGTLVANSIQPDVGTNLYLDATQGSGNVVFGNTTTSLVSISPTGNITSRGTITANGISSASGNLSVVGAVSATGNISGSNIVSSGTVSGSSVSSTGNISANNITSSYDITASSFNGGPLGGMRNRIINGAMMIDQRNAGASVTPTTNGTYTLDRWKAGLNNASKYSIQQSTTAPAGFNNSILVTSLASTTVAVGDYYSVSQSIEGFNFSDCNFGTANAKTITLSFWVRSSLTGTFGGWIQNDIVDRSYPFSYAISSANTWEQKTITIAGDTTGTWVGATNGVGLIFGLSLGMGTARQGTANTWASGNYRSVTGETPVVGTNGATFYITGVQLEKGATATPFENRLYGTELALCYRYYRQTITQANAEGTIYGYGVATTGFVGQSVPYPVPMRSSATAAYAGTWVRVNATGGIQAFSDSYLPFLTPTSTGTAQQYGNNSGYITFSAEL